MAPLVLAGRLSRKKAKKPADEADWYHRRSVRAAVVLFAIRARRLIEGTGKDTGKGLLRSRISGRYHKPAGRYLAGRAPPAAGYARECSARDFPLLYCKTAVADAIFEYPALGAQYHQYAAVDADCHQSIPR